MYCLKNDGVADSTVTLDASSARQATGRPAWSWRDAVTLVLVALLLSAGQRRGLPVCMLDLPSPDDGGGGDFFGFLGAIIDAILSIAQQIIAFVITNLIALATIAEKIAGALADGFKVFGQWLLKLVDILRRFWSNVLQPLLQTIARVINDLKAWLQRVFGPLIKILRDVADVVRAFYKAYVRPILDIIDAFRVFLGGLSALGVNWAKELDHILQQVEDQINAPFTEVLKIINQISGILDRIMTLDGIFTRLIWVQSLAGYKLPTSRFLWNIHSTAVDASHLYSLRKDAVAPEPSDVQGATLDYLQTRGGDLAPAASELETQIRLWFSAQ